MSNNHENRLQVLTWRMLDGLATDQEMDELNEILKDRPESQLEYLRLVDLHCELASPTAIDPTKSNPHSTDAEASSPSMTDQRSIGSGELPVYRFDRRKWLTAGLGSTVAASLGLFAYTRSCVAGARRERDHYDEIRNLLSEAFDFVEDDINASSELKRLSQILTQQRQFARPRFPENTPLANQVEARLHACLTMSYTRMGAFELANNHALQAIRVSDALRDSDEDRSIQMLARYVLAKLRFEEARHEVKSPKQPLAKVRTELGQAISLLNTQTPATQAELLFNSRVYALLAAITHKSGKYQEALQIWARVSSTLDQVPSNQRGFRWNLLKARSYADQCLSLVNAHQTQQAIDGCDAGLLLIAREPDTHYLQGILHSNKADAIAAHDIHYHTQRFEEQIKARTQAIEALFRFWDGGQSAFENKTPNAFDNIILNYGRRAIVWHRMGKRDLAIRDTIAVSGLTQLTNRHRQMGAGLIPFWLLCSCDPHRTQDRSTTFRQLAISEIDTLLTQTKRTRPDHFERVKSYIADAVIGFLGDPEIKQQMSDSGILKRLDLDKEPPDKSP